MNSFGQFGEQRIYRIPLNQRSYSWSIRNLQDVIKDLELATAREKNHYLGPLILSTHVDPLIEDTQNVSLVCDLEDGQQRVTSFLILLSAIRNRLLAIDNKETLDSEGIDRVVCYLQGNERKLRMTNENPQLDACLKHLILGSPAYPSNETAPMQRIKEAVSWSSDWVSDMDRIECIRWKNSILNRAKFILVDLSKEHVDRYLTFDAINSRGQPLSQFDKIKNFCILVNDVRNLGMSPEVKWYQSLQHLERYGRGDRSVEETFINELVNVFHNLRVVKDSTHTSFSEMYHTLLNGSNQVLETNLVSFVNMWPLYAQSFAFITSKDRKRYYGIECSSGAGEWLDRLSNMGYPEVVRPILVSGHLIMKSEEFEALARLCEVYTFRLHGVIGARSNTNTTGVIKLANELIRNDKDVVFAGKVICDWLGRYASMRDVLARLSDGTAKYAHDPTTKGWKHCYYFLYEYELSQSPQGVGPIPYAEDKEAEKNTQEHILPQQHRDGDWWEQHWPDAAAADRYKHRLGNLVLTSDNPTLGRKSFELKCSDANARYSYTSAKATNSEKQLPAYSPDGNTWQREQIVRREYDLLKFAVERWSVPCCVDNGDYYLPEAFASLNLVSIIVRNTSCVDLLTSDTTDQDDIGSDDE